MDIRKTPGSVTRHSVDREDMALINRLAKTELTPEQVYTFAVRLCDNEVDRDWERFDEAGLEALSALFVGKSGIFDHHWSAQEQTARLYRTEVCRESGTTAAGDGIRYLKGYAYMLRSEKNRELIEEIEGGIKKEVSVSCAVERAVCSICGEEFRDREACAHVKGREYEGKLCWVDLVGATDAYEWSFVAVPAQPNAGVLKGFRQDARMEQLEREAALGRKYLEGLRFEVARLGGLARPELDSAVRKSIAGKLEEGELLALKRAYERVLEEKFPVKTQLTYDKAGQSGGAPDRAFLI